MQCVAIYGRGGIYYESTAYQDYNFMENIVIIIDGYQLCITLTV